jgi:hypothetical protein
MNFTLLNPLLLFGLAATVLPILIHRITRKKVSERKFSAVYLLLRSQRIAARPQRLKHLLLLALRILAVAIVVFLMARPMLMRPGFAALLKGGAKVLILDNSMSMGYLEDRGLRFDVAKKAAVEALEDFGGQVSIIPTVGFRKEPESQWLESEEVPVELERVPLSFGPSNTASAFKRAYQSLKDLKISKQILILSDMARGDWADLDLTRFENISDAEVTFLRVGGPARDANFGVKDVRLAEGEIVAGVPTRLEVTISNHSDQKDKRLVQVNLDGVKVDQKSIELKAGQDLKLIFELLVDAPGWIDGEVKLTPDRLPADDIFYFPLNVKEKVRVLVVDGDPKTSLRGSESYFLVSALRPGGLEKSPFLTRVITESELSEVDPQSYDTLFLLNVPRPDFSKMGAFIEMGKPLFIFLGDRIVPEVYNQFPLAPWQIGERIDLREGDEKITQIDANQSMTKFFTRLQDSLKSASVRTYFKIEGNPNTLLTLKNQDPLFVEASVGKSKLFMLSSSADLDWNDLPLNAAYVPLIQGLVRDTVGLTGTGLPEGMTFGQPFSEDARPLQIKGPEGGVGIYQFNLPAGEMRQGVNTPQIESNLSKLGEDELRKKFGAIDVKVVDYKEGSLKNLKGGRRELWPFLLLLLFVVLAFEMILANGIPLLKRTSPIRQEKADNKV